MGCTLNNYKHSAYELELGMPEWLARLNDHLHEKTSENVWPAAQINFSKSRRAWVLGLGKNPSRIRCVYAGTKYRAC